MQLCQVRAVQGAAAQMAQGWAGSLRERLGGGTLAGAGRGGARLGSTLHLQALARRACNPPSSLPCLLRGEAQQAVAGPACLPAYPPTRSLTLRRLDSFAAATVGLHRVQLMIPAEAAHDTVAALGEVGMLQFKDLNAERTAFQRTYANQVRAALHCSTATQC